MTRIPGVYVTPDGGPPPDPPKKRWARVVYFTLHFMFHPYLLIAGFIGYGYMSLRDIPAWPLKWYIVGAIVAILLGTIAVKMMRTRRAWNRSARFMHASNACPKCGYDLVNVAHLPPSPGVPGATVRCPECGHGMGYIGPDEAMAELARAGSGRNDAATERAIDAHRVDLATEAAMRKGIDISGGENGSV